MTKMKGPPTMTPRNQNAGDVSDLILILMMAIYIPYIYIYTPTKKYSVCPSYAFSVHFVPNVAILMGQRELLASSDLLHRIVISPHITLLLISVLNPLKGAVIVHCWKEYF
jgi:hypothetical protein